jgi:hypothetical protein
VSDEMSDDAFGDDGPVEADTGSVLCCLAGLSAAEVNRPVTADAVACTSYEVRQ